MVLVKKCIQNDTEPNHFLSSPMNKQKLMNLLDFSVGGLGLGIRLT